MEEKTMHLANFNITFGDKEEPMLARFADIIYPAFTSNYVRGKKDELPVFLFSDVRIKECKNGEFVLVGNYIKQTQHEVHTKVENGFLTDAPAKVPTAPYSRFIIFLRNHRMILVRNEAMSPDIRSFQTTVRYLLDRYVRHENKEKDKASDLPYAFVNIVDIPLENDIDDVLMNIEKIEWIKLRFFPLNNDIDQSPMSKAVRAQMAMVQSRTGGLQLNSPGSKEGIKKMIINVAGQAIPTIRVLNSKGEKNTIKESKDGKEKSFSSNKKIAFASNIHEKDDEFLISKAQEDDIIRITSDDNRTWYEKSLAVIRTLL